MRSQRNSSLWQKMFLIRMQKSAKNEEQHYNIVASHLLKDTGIKTRIIKQYLLINTLVNKYLQSMDFFVHFELDEKFNETIKSRHRDRFSYTHSVRVRNNASTWHCCSHGERLQR